MIFNVHSAVTNIDDVPHDEILKNIRDNGYDVNIEDYEKKYNVFKPHVVRF